MGPTTPEVLAWVRSRGSVTDPVMRQRIAQIHIEHTLLDLIRLRTLTARLRGEQPGPEASVRKALADEHGQHVMSVARDLLGADALLTGDMWHGGFLFSQALTIGGGTGQVQRNIIGERVLGLPAEPDPQAGLSWADTNATRSRP
jgi:alkylation response protein AidB-like acyl-CoA dehydrogenase